MSFESLLYDWLLSLNIVLQTSRSVTDVTLYLLQCITSFSPPVPQTFPLLLSHPFKFFLKLLSDVDIVERFGAAINAGANASPAGKLQLSVNFLAVEGL